MCVVARLYSPLKHPNIQVTQVEIPETVLKTNALAIRAFISKKIGLPPDHITLEVHKQSYSQYYSGKFAGSFALSAGAVFRPDDSEDVASALQPREKSTLFTFHGSPLLYFKIVKCKNSFHCPKMLTVYRMYGLAGHIFYNDYATLGLMKAEIQGLFGREHDYRLIHKGNVVASHLKKAEGADRQLLSSFGIKDGDSISAVFRPDSYEVPL